MDLGVKAYDVREEKPKIRFQRDVLIGHIAAVDFFGVGIKSGVITQGQVAVKNTAPD